VKSEAAACPECGGSGLRLITGADGARYAQECLCRAGERALRRIRRAAIPPRYEDCSLESFETEFKSADPSLGRAHSLAARFVADYPQATEGRGLLFVGTVGLGKTHLAVSVLRALVTEKGAGGLFCDYRDLLKQIRNSYDPQVATTEMDVLRPVLEAEVLVLDELGAEKPTAWIWDTVAHILNTRYNEKRSTIITTNYSDLPPEAARGGASREETLGDRIGERMRSRLAEMCVTVKMKGADFRRAVRPASFGWLGEEWLS
jgi:DNA replication protein DnaC